MQRTQRALALFLSGVIFSSVASFVNVEPIQAGVATNVRQKKKRESVVQHLASLFRRRKTPAGTRGDTVCLVTPDQSGDRLIWNNQPLLVWQGETASRVQVRIAGSDIVVWDKTLSETQTNVTYHGADLKPNEVYEVEFFDQKGKKLNEDSDMLPKFTLMDFEQRFSITQQLQQIEQKMIADKRTAEEIIAAKAEYLLKHDLVSDAFQVVYDAKDAVPQFKPLLEEITEITCGEKAIAASQAVH